MRLRISSRGCVVRSRWLLLGVMLPLARLAVAGPQDVSVAQVAGQSGAPIASGTSALARDQTGVVKSANQPIPGATVSATQGTTIVVTTTDQNGRYSLQLGDGAWVLEVTMVGFQPARQGLTVSNAFHPLDFTLQLKESPMTARPRTSAAGRAGEQNPNQVESQLQTESQSNTQQVVPAENADDSDEAFLVSGTLSKGPSQNAAQGSSSLQSGFGDQSGEQVAGIGTPSLSVPGFGKSSKRSARGNPAPRLSGSRRRANEIHGALSVRFDNSALNAKPFSISGQDIHQPAYAQSRFSAAVGGPLVIPRIIKDPSTFFFFNYFGTRNRNPYTAVETVPTQLERQGNFSESIQSGGSVRIYDPLTRQPFNGNVIPESRIDPIARSLLGYFPQPNVPGLVNNYVLQASVPRDTDDIQLRVQRNITNNDRLAYSLTFQRRDGDVSQPFGFLDTTSGDGLNTDLQWTRNISARITNNVRVAFKRNSNETTPYFANGENVALELGIQGTSSNPLNYGPPNLNFTNFGALSDASPVLTRNQSQSLGDNVIALRGTHSFTFGIQFTRNDLNIRTDPNGRGTFNFTGLLTSATTNRSPVAGTGFDFADFLLGLPQSSSIRYGDSSTYLRQNVWTAFAQDDWKVRPNLTLNFGLRYEYFAPFSEKYGRIANLDIASGYSAVAVVTPGTSGPFSGGFPLGLINPDYNNFSPRVALAWKIPYFKQSTIVRAGYGVYYNGQAYSRLAFKLAQQPPFAVSSNVNTSLSHPLTLAEGFVSTAPGDVTNTFAVDRYYRTPYAQTWNLTIQRELGNGFFVEAGYLGAKGTRLEVLTLPNQGPPGAPSRDKHQLGNAVGFTYDSSVGNSILHALTVRATQRFRHGISMNAHYQFSKSIDDSSTFGGAGNTVAQNWLDLAAERGLSSFDRRHSFDIDWVLTSPVGAIGSRFADHSWTTGLLKDWQLSGALIAQTGTPLTARVLGNSAIALAQTAGVGSGRADATGLGLSSANDFFNLAAFTIPPPGKFGNAGRNTISGPDFFVVNLGFGRSFQLDEKRRRLEFRIEANNVFNNVSFTNINTVVNATNYGLPISAALTRIIDAKLRFRF